MPTFAVTKTSNAMVEKKDIGKKVWLLDGSAEKGFVLKTKDGYTIKAVGDEARWPVSVILEKDGKEIATNGYAVVFAPEGDNILKYLEDNDVSSAVNAYENSDGQFEVDIEWGDWKHDHAWCDNLMGYLGYRLVDENETEEDGSDCYSSEHIYEKAE